MVETGRLFAPLVHDRSSVPIYFRLDRVDSLIMILVSESSQDRLIQSIVVQQS